MELVIFDCDGVLVDSEVIANAVTAEALSGIGYPITSAETIDRFVGMPDKAMYAIIEAEMGRPLPAGFAAQVSDRIARHYRQDLRAIAHASEVLAALPLKICVASSSSPAKLALGLIETGLYELLYPHIYSTALVARGKPHPDIFEYAARACDTAPDQCLVIEDSVAGVTAARASQMAVIGFTGGGHCGAGQGARLTEAGALAVIDDLRDLPRYLGLK